MKKRINQIAALFLIYLLLVSPLTSAQDELPQEQFPAQGQEFDYENAFNNNPPPENFNNLPPSKQTAENLAKVQNPTLENFNNLPPAEQGIYLGDETRYRQDFANQYWSTPANWGKNPDAEKFLFTETRFRDLLRAGDAQKRAAEQYFNSQFFPAEFAFVEIDDDFQYDSVTKVLKN